MDDLFSTELKELIAKSREVALSLGYDYISTIHFFIADCDINRQTAIMNFAFSDYNEFTAFKKGYTLQKTDFFDFTDESLPLTKEAEEVIGMLESERIFYKQTEVFPCHFFIAALKNKNSLLFECYKHDEHALDNLITYYKTLGAFEKSKMSEEQIAKEYYMPNIKNKSGFFSRMSKIFKKGK